MGRLNWSFLSIDEKIGKLLLYCHTPTYNDRLTVQDECVGW